ncbi:hypothetical protein R1T16_12450 [Flavobacterium sp. DG1-102-2]|uniref:hypothetical protein n=1 Tax=Flavobacterium sp. DG1-102-2 TaxID=3081663 RepID=UPI00294A754C|nr:hypothetical protein [Flavobacterium sp. DG1-102-2]MDV6169237.1 hypothetical protein [Flavobacterium sp. DG1-102-2]
MNRKQNKDYFIPIDKASVAFLDNNGINVNVKGRATENNCTYVMNQYFDNNLNPYQSKNSIIIHAHETLYFEWFLVLPFGTFAEDIRYYIDLDKTKSYYSEFYIYSDGHDYANKISKPDLQTIKKKTTIKFLTV